MHVFGVEFYSEEVSPMAIGSLRKLFAEAKVMSQVTEKFRIWVIDEQEVI